MNLCCNQTVPHQKRLFKQLSNCLTSFHFQVAERAIYFFNNEYLISLIAENPKELIPLVFPALYQSSQTHWNRAINNLVFNTFHILMQIDNDVYQQCHEQQKVRVSSLYLFRCRILFPLLFRFNIFPFFFFFFLLLLIYCSVFQ